MDHRVHNRIVSFIWTIADDVLRDVFVRGKYRDIILPFTVIRRLDVLLQPTKEKVLQGYQFLLDNKIDNHTALTSQSGFPFYNTSKFTFESLLNDPDHIDTNLEHYLDGFSENVQVIISRFKLRNQLETMSESGVTYALIEKLTSKDLNLSPNEALDSRGEKLPPLTNLAMGYVFEELIRKFNEENNEEAGEHFTPREIIKLMTNIVFEPIQDLLKDGAHYLVYDPCCGSGGMLTEAENHALDMTNNGIKLSLYGQEVNPETYAICTSDMLIKGEDAENIAFGSTLSKDGFPDKKFDFMLSNPPYGKSWQLDYDSIVDEKTKTFKDHRFTTAEKPVRSSDGQLLFLANMVSKMKHNSDLGSRIASVHNGSALFTGDAGGGESNMRKWFIDNDYIECIIGLPKGMFYNTGIATYIFILSNRKEAHRKGKVQLIDASELYVKMRKNLGSKNSEFSEEQIKEITQTYLDFKESEISKIFNNDDFGYQKITVERPLRLRTEFTREAVDELRFVSALASEMKWVYSRFGDAVYTNLKEYSEKIMKHFEKEENSLSPANRKKLLDVSIWKDQKAVYELANKLLAKFEGKVYTDFNIVQKEVDKALKDFDAKPSATAKKQILNAVSVRDENAEPIVKKKEKDGTILYESDSELRDTENVPLTENIEEYFQREVIPHVPDAWIDYSKTVIGYEISFTKYFYKYQPLRDLDDITADILALEAETDGILKEIVQ